MAGKTLLTPGNRLHLKLDLMTLDVQIEGIHGRHFRGTKGTGDQLIALVDTQADIVLIFTDIKRLGATVFIAKYIGSIPMEALQEARRPLVPENGACEECGEPPHRKHKLDCATMRAIGDYA